MDYSFYPGTGLPVVFLHGWGADKNSLILCKNALYNPTLFVSFSGFGNSPVPPRPYFVADFMAELKELLDSLKLKRVIIVCHSFGLRVAAKLIANYPSMVQKLVIIDGAGLKPRRKLGYYIKVRKYKRLKKKVLAGKADKRLLDGYGSSDYKALCPVMKQTFVNVVNEDLKSDIKKIKCPTLIFWGKEDKETPLYMAKKLHRLIHNSGLYMLDGGHFCFLDSAREFLLALCAFV